ncbi:MAG: DUF4202 domain-containing protein, partial [Candidatus Tectomicrobia bacterium]|nr:DUF4202 domain-containing protein [Candidatus Tectomicrobia bacterium]
MSTDQERFHAAISRFDAANAEDPSTETFQGQEYPKELLYAQRMSAWLAKLAPEASEVLRLAVRCQHIQRWTIPRHTYPMDRHGYLRWRTTLAKFHAETAGTILQEVGYDDVTITRVQSLLRKESLKRDSEVQCLEDVICLVFLESYVEVFATQHDEAKILDILQKTWKKMSPRGQEVAL